MKHRKPIFIVLLVIFLTQLACGNALPDAYDPATGKLYKVVPLWSSLEDPYPNGYELVPAEPLTQADVDQILSELGLNGSDTVQFIALEADWQINEDGSIGIKSLYVGETQYSFTGGGKLASLSPQAGCIPKDARAYAMHMAKKMLDAGLGVDFVVSFLSDLADGKIVPDFVADSGNGSRIVIKATYLGKQLIVVLGRSVGATFWHEINAANVTALFRGMTKLPGSSKKAIQIMSTSVATFFRCVRDNWPKNAEERDRATKDHNDVYGREIGKVPANFPVKIPFTVNGKELTLLEASASQYTSPSIRQLTDEEMFAMVGLGLLTFVVIAAPEVAIPVGLAWATVGAH